MHAIICDEGFESTVAKDITRFNVTDVSNEKTVVFFNCDTKELHKIAYMFQGAIKVIQDVVLFEALADLEKIKPTLPRFENITGTLCVSCVRKGAHDFRSVDLASTVANMYENPKQYKQAETNLFVYIKDRAGYVGYDVSGRTLTKRDYKIFQGAASLRATIAYNLVSYAGVTAKTRMLDPFMGSGTILVEAGLRFTNTSPFFFSKDKFAGSFDYTQFDDAREQPQLPFYGFDSLLKFLKYAQKNAKIADINKSITLSKTSIDWLDTKIEEKSIDVIITDPPCVTEHGSKSKILKVYADFFNQAKYVLGKKGSIVIITTEQSASYVKEQNDSFRVTDEFEVYEGAQKLLVLRFER